MNIPFMTAPFALTVLFSQVNLGIIIQMSQWTGRHDDVGDNLTVLRKVISDFIVHCIVL